MDKKMILLGFSGHVYSVIDCIRSMEMKISGYFELKANSSNHYHLDYLGSEHECSIGKHSHIGPGAILAGNVKNGKNTFIGANATVIQGIQIGDNVSVGDGSVVIQDIKDKKTYVDNPARQLKT
jgi:acetyltransferase-like isoleucine patch superfamily enzyme